MRTINLILDQERQNEPIKLQGILQGNKNIQFKIKLAQNGTLIDIDNMKKPKVIYRWLNINKAYVFDESADGYDITVADNTITIPSNERMVMGYGQVQIKIVLDDLYTYSCSYNVDRNLDYKATLIDPTSPHNYALEDLSNVPKSKFDEKAKASNLMKNDMADVDLDKLNDKFKDTDSGKELKQQGIDLGLKANADMLNVSPSTFNRELTQNKAFQDLQNKHPDTTGKTDAEIKALFYTNRFEETNAVDLTQPPFDAPTTLLMVYQMNSEGGTIRQVLPPHTTNQIIMVEMLFAKGVSNATLEIDVVSGEHIEGITGQTNALTFDKQGYLGYFLPLQNSQGYEFVSHHETMITGITMRDSQSNVSLGVKDITFDDSFTLEDSQETLKIKFNGKSASALPFVDGKLEKEFVPTKVQSQDKTIRIANLGGVADLSVNDPLSNEGVMATLGTDRLYNSKYDNEKIFFGDVKHKGGSFVHFNNQDGSIILQEIDGKDPLVTGGTLFLLGLYYEPNMLDPSTLNQDGYFRIELVDQNGDILIDVDGNPMGAEIHYLQGQKERNELYLGFIKATTYTEVRARFVNSFTSQEVLTVGANTAIVAQPIGDDYASGLPILNFMAYTGIRLNMNKKYYGYNSLNLARYLVFDEPLSVLTPQTTSLGENSYIDNRSNINMQIANNELVITDNGVSQPVFSIFKLYDNLDTSFIKEQNITADVIVNIVDKVNAFNVLFMKYTGTETTNIPKPNVLSFNNSNPVFATGWEIIDTLFIPEDAVQGEHIATKEFIVPNDSNIKQMAILLHQVAGGQPLNLKLKDFEVDIKPPFSKMIVTNNLSIKEELLLTNKEYYKSRVDCPNGYSAYRFTINSTDTKIPVGVFKGGDGKIINDNAWTDVGAIDPNKVQGDIKFLVDGKVNMEYGGQLFNEQSSENNIDFWIAKLNGDGTFTEVPNSRYTSTIEANKTTPKKFLSKAFTFDVKANESYRVFAKSNKDDGCYVQASPNGNTLFYTSIVFNELQLSNTDVMEKANEVIFMENGKEVYNKMLQYDITTGKMTVIDKK